MMTPTEILATRERRKTVARAEERALIARRLIVIANYLSGLESSTLLPMGLQYQVESARHRLGTVVDFLSEIHPT